MSDLQPHNLETTELQSGTASTESCAESSGEPLVIDALGWVYVSGRQLLCTRSYDKDAFYLPGGKREPGESDAQAITREVREEISLTLALETLRPFATISSPAHGQGPNAQVVLICYESGFSGEVRPAGEIAEISWFGYGDRHRCAPATAMVLDQLYQQGRID